LQPDLHIVDDPAVAVGGDAADTSEETRELAIEFLRSRALDREDHVAGGNRRPIMPLGPRVEFECQSGRIDPVPGLCQPWDESRLIGCGEILGEIGQPKEHQVGHFTIRRIAAEQGRNGRHRLTGRDDHDRAAPG